ncbi:MAG: NAD(P)-binding domain-containing protein [Deltaproteobacteria bacterium]
MRVGVIGSGLVGQVLADGFLQHGHEVMRGSRTPEKLSAWAVGAGERASVGTFAVTAVFGEVVVLAVKGSAAEAAVAACGDALSGKTVIDTTNPIDDRPPESGVLHFFTDLNHALMERLQARAPEAKFVKAFSCVGSGVMVDPVFSAGRPTMFICGNDSRAKANVSELLDDFGWDVADLGGAVAARAIEPLCILWCIPGFLNKQWTHAFKLLVP